MTDYGVTDEGFVIKPLERIKTEIENKEKADFGNAIDVTATSVLGQINGIMAGKLSELWELAQAIYSAMDPDSANTSSLENVAALCPGIVRNPATNSTVTATCNLDDGTYLAGSLIAHVDGDPTARFINTEEIVRTGGTGDESVVMEADTAGATVALAGTLTVIAEPVTGWNSVTNTADATVGDEVETDTELRLRREQVIARSGGSSVSGIRADVLAVEGVDICNIRENVTDETVQGLPPHSIHVVVHSTLVTFPDDEVTRAIYDSKPAGIGTYGNDYVKYYDSGYPIYIYYDQFTEVDLWFELSITSFDDEGTTTADLLKTVIANSLADLQMRSIAGHYIHKSQIIGVIQDFLSDYTPNEGSGYSKYFVYTLSMDIHASPDDEPYVICDYDEIFITDSSKITIDGS